MADNICKKGRKKNLGKSKCTALPKLWKTIIWTPDNFSLQPADYATPAALKTALQALLTNPYDTRGYLFPRFSLVEDNSEEAIYEDTPNARIPVRDGQYRYKPMISHNMCTHIAMFSHRAINTGRILILDVANQLFGTDPLDDGVLQGFSLSLLWTEKLRISDGSVSTKSPIVIDLADNEEIDQHGVLLDGSVVNTLEPLTDVEITLTEGDAFAAAGFMVDVKQKCDGTPVSGLLLADFLMYAADGITPQVIDTATPDANVPGRYNLIPDTAFVDGSLTLRAPAALTVKAYEVVEALAVNVP